MNDPEGAARDDPAVPVDMAISVRGGADRLAEQRRVAAREEVSATRRRATSSHVSNRRRTRPGVPVAIPRGVPRTRAVCP